MQRLKEPHAQDPRKLGSGKWQARVTYYDADTGKRREISQSFATEREAKKWGREQEIAYRDDPHRKPPSDETLGDYLTRWLDDVAAGQVQDTTLVAYRRYAKPIMMSAVALKALKALTPMDFQVIYTQMTQAGKAPVTVRHTHTIVHSALDDAVEWGLIPTNPTLHAKPPRKGPQATITPPTPAESKMLLGAAEQDRLKALWWFIALTGCRRGEALGLQWDDIDEQHRLVHIRRTLASDGALRSIHEPKTSAGRRMIAVTPYLLEILHAHHGQQRLERVAMGSDWNTTPYVFVNQKGGLLWPNNVWLRFKRLLRRAGVVETIRIHDLRHAMATFWLANGVPVKVVSERLGHANISITLQIYGHLLPNMQADAADEMEALFLRSEDPPLAPSTRHPHEGK